MSTTLSLSASLFFTNPLIYENCWKSATCWKKFLLILSPNFSFLPRFLSLRLSFSLSFYLFSTYTGKERVREMKRKKQRKHKDALYPYVWCVCRWCVCVYGHSYILHVRVCGRMYVSACICLMDRMLELLQTPSNIWFSVFLFISLNNAHLTSHVIALRLPLDSS